MYLDGISLRQMAKSLNRAGLRTITGCEFAEAYLDVMIHNEIYAGDIRRQKSYMAQEESRSISENVTWGYRKRFADGKVMVPFGRFLGYERGEDGSLVVNEKQAQIVRRIYGMFLQGRSPYTI